MTMRSAAGTASPAEPFPPDGPDVSDLLGDWLNADRGAVSQGPLRLTVSRCGTGVAVRAFGGTAPEGHFAAGRHPDDWGEVPATVYTALGTPSVAWSFSAVYELGAFRTVLSGYHKTGILVATTSTIALDGDGRLGEWTRSFFHRVEERS
ncbi:hypothetical protein ACWD4G_40105 [Streptomyces sp. NPDC002643]